MSLPQPSSPDPLPLRPVDIGVEASPFLERSLAVEMQSLRDRIETLENLLFSKESLFPLTNVSVKELDYYWREVYVQCGGKCNTVIIEGA